MRLRCLDITEKRKSKNDFSSIPVYPLAMSRKSAIRKIIVLEGIKNNRHAAVIRRTQFCPSSVFCHSIFDRRIAASISTSITVIAIKTNGMKVKRPAIKKPIPATIKTKSIQRHASSFIELLTDSNIRNCTGTFLCECFMCAIAIWRVIGMFTPTPRYFFLLCYFDFNW